jgi:hypothetical protein
MAFYYDVSVVFIVNVVITVFQLISFMTSISGVANELCEKRYYYWYVVGFISYTVLHQIALIVHSFIKK